MFQNFRCTHPPSWEVLWRIDFPPLNGLPFFTCREFSLSSNRFFDFLFFASSPPTGTLSVVRTTLSLCPSVLPPSLYLSNCPNGGPPNLIFFVTLSFSYAPGPFHLFIQQALAVLNAGGPHFPNVHPSFPDSPGTPPPTCRFRPGPENSPPVLFFSP